MTDETTSPKRRQLSDGEHFKAMGMMHDHLRGPVAGLWTYADGYSDQKIADTLGNGVTLANIEGLRLRAFGKLSKADPITDPRLDMVIAAHNEFVRDLCGALEETLSKPFDATPYLIGADK